MPYFRGYLLFIILLLIFSGCVVITGEQGLQSGYLRAEHKIDPLGIDNKEPSLSWIVTSKKRNQKQTAYQILVASRADLLNSEVGDLWDSGKVESEETLFIKYDGNPLASGQPCFWKVKVWDEEDQASPWSQPAYWSMGLLEPGDWKAQWIGLDQGDLLPKKQPSPSDPPEESTLILPQPQYLRFNFSLDKPILRATAYASALGICELRTNGQQVEEDYFTPGWTDYNKRIYYCTYDVTSFLKEGANTLAAILADGWYAGYIGYKKERDLYGKNLRLLAQVVVEYEDGTQEIIATNPSWKASTGPLLEADFLMGEAFDAQQEMPGWDEPGFDDSLWKSVKVESEEDPPQSSSDAEQLPPPFGALIEAHPGVPVRAIAEIKPIQITQVSDDQYIFDLGQNFAGVVRLKVKAAPGQKITLRYGERLNSNGTLYTANLRSARAKDTYICKGSGVEVWEPKFTFHGFQYVEVTGYPGVPREDTIMGIALSSDTPPVGKFLCSDGTINQLISNIYWTQRANFIDIPTDCPQRDERLGWTGDAQVYLHSACLLLDTQAFFHKWLVDLKDAQRQDGQFPMVAPLKVAGGDGGPGWADAGVICPWTLYKLYGNKQVLAQHYPSMTRFVEFCKGRSPNLLPPNEFHCFGDWLNIDAETPKEVIYTAYFAYSTYLTACAAQALGYEEDALKYSRLQKEIKASFNNAYVDSEGHIKGDTQCGYVLALAFDLLDPNKERYAAQHLIEDIKKRGWHLSTGFLGTKDLMLVLSKIGRNDVAYKLLHNSTFPSWGFSIAHGATSIWERWNGWTPGEGFADPGMNSFAHYAFGAVLQWIFEIIGGIRAIEPGFKRILIQPEPGGSLTFAKTSYQSIRGYIATEWRLQGGMFYLQLTIPANTTALVYMPTRDSANVFEGGKPVDQSKDIKILNPEGDKAVFEVASGRYFFEAPFVSEPMPN